MHHVRARGGGADTLEWLQSIPAFAGVLGAGPRWGRPMTSYLVFKYLHVALAIAWLGGGLTVLMLGAAAARKNDPAEQLAVIRQVVYLSNRLFVPASLGALITGAIAASILGLWGQAWVIIGLMGFAATFGLGFFIIKPRAERIAALSQAEGPSAAVTALGRELIEISKFDYVLLFVIVAAMVLKPQWREFVTILLMLAVIAAAGWLFLRTVLQQMMPRR